MSAAFPGLWSDARVVLPEPDSVPGFLVVAGEKNGPDDGEGPDDAALFIHVHHANPDLNHLDKDLAEEVATAIAAALTAAADAARQPAAGDRVFPIADVISACADILVSEISGVYDVLGHMLDEPLMTHQLPAAAAAAEPHALARWPWLADRPRRLEGEAKDAFLVRLGIWVGRMTERHGDTLPVPRLDHPDWARGSALADLMTVADGKPVIAITTPDTEDQP